MDGLISVDEARAYAQEHWPSPVVRRQIEALLDNCPRVGLQWISVMDALPGKNTEVLVFTSSDACDIGYYSNCGNWVCFATDRPDIVVTHWMHLPKPPKEG